jgi:hypothetical protein
MSIQVLYPGQAAFVPMVPARGARFEPFPLSFIASAGRKPVAIIAK